LLIFNFELIIFGRNSQFILCASTLIIAIFISIFKCLRVKSQNIVKINENTKIFEVSVENAYKICYN